jgi:YfiH family protein
VNGAWLRPGWAAASRVRACFTLRGGGASRAPYDSFNLGAHVGDAPAAVAENRRRLREALELPGEPLWLAQVHGAGILDADAPGGCAAAPEADAAVTRRPGTVLAVLVADCLPVLLAARDGSAVAVAHAGWRGLAAGVIETAGRALAGHGTLQAWLGPCIGPGYFEVGAEVRAAFLAQDPGAAAAFEPNARGRWQCDLKALARARLAACGVAAVCEDRGCSFAEPERFFSHRREGRTGRMAALVWLDPRGC